MQDRGPHGASDAHETPIRVRYDEVDRMGVVHHPRYLGYFEQGRTELLRSLGGSYRGLEDSGTLLMVVETSARYLKPARYDEELVVRTRFTSAGPVRLRFEYEVVRGRDLLATGHTLLAACDRDGRLRRLPDDFRALIEAGGAPARVSGKKVSGKSRPGAAVQGT